MSKAYKMARPDRRRRGSPRERFLAKIVAGPAGCMIWTAYRAPEGYGMFTISRQRKAMPAHRFAYEEFVGPIPEGMQVDHQCHNADPRCPGGPTCLHRRCVNPHHLDVVTPRENTLRSQHTKASRWANRDACGNGHPFTSENTAWRSRRDNPEKKYRHCRTCRRNAKALAVTR